MENIINLRSTIISLIISIVLLTMQINTFSNIIGILGILFFTITLIKRIKS